MRIVGSGMLKIRVSGLFKAIERWASASDKNMRLMIILIWIGFGVLVLIATLVAAWITVPSDSKLG